MSSVYEICVINIKVRIGMCDLYVDRRIMLKCVYQKGSLKILITELSQGRIKWVVNIMITFKLIKSKECLIS